MLFLFIQWHALTAVCHVCGFIGERISVSHSGLQASVPDPDLQLHKQENTNKSHFAAFSMCTFSWLSHSFLRLPRLVTWRLFLQTGHLAHQCMDPPSAVRPLFCQSVKCLVDSHFLLQSAH